MKIKLEPWALKPTRAHATDAGLDLYAPEDVVILPASPFAISSSLLSGNFGSAVIDTGVAVELPHGTFGKLESKSGLNVKHDIVSCGGVIDQGYSGNIMVKLYNLGDRPYQIYRGDKIVQLIVQPCRYEPVEIVDEITAGDRGDAGFGSTGR